MGNQKFGANKQRLALFALMLMASVWGYNWVVMKRVLSFVGPYDFTALRTGVAAVVLVIILIVTKIPFKIPKQAWFRVVLLGILQTSAFPVLIQLALQNGSAGKSSILTYTMPFWVIPIAWIAFNERISRNQFITLIIASIGLFFILQPWVSGSSSYKSEIYAIAGGFCWALSAIVAKWIKRDFDIPALQLTTLQMIFGAIALIVLAFLIDEKPIDPSPYFFIALAYNAFLATSMAWFLWLFALQHLSAGMASMISMCVPVISVLAGWLELGEQPNQFELIGMILIGAALFGLSLISLRK